MDMVLKNAKDVSLKLKNTNIHWYQIKMLEKVKTSFINQVQAESWEDAKKPPTFASEEKLSLFVPNFNADSYDLFH